MLHEAHDQQHEGLDIGQPPFVGGGDRAQGPDIHHQAVPQHADQIATTTMNPNLVSLLVWIICGITAMGLFGWLILLPNDQRHRTSAGITILTVFAIMIGTVGIAYVALTRNPISEIVVSLLLLAAVTSLAVALIDDHEPGNARASHPTYRTAALTTRSGPGQDKRLRVRARYVGREPTTSMDEQSISTRFGLLIRGTPSSLRSRCGCRERAYWPQTV